MALPSISDLKMWVGTLFTKDDWDFNFSKITGWLSDGNADLVVNSIKPTNGIDMDGSKITNVGAATTGSDAVNLDTATTLLNRTSYYYPFSVASGKVSSGLAAYLQKDSDTQVTVLAGNTNPDLVVIQSDGTVESVTSNTVLTVSTSDGTYNVVKEKAQSIVITSGKVTVGNTQPASPSAGDYFLDNSTVPFKGYKYNAVGGWTVTEFCHLGSVVVASGVATVNQFAYNNNRYNVNLVQSYISGTSGYRVYSDGYCEQWGQIQTAGYGRTSTVSLTKIFANTDYQVLLTWTYETMQGDHGSTACYRASGKATDNFIIYSCFENYQPIVTWRVLGYLASGQY